MSEARFMRTKLLLGKEGVQKLKEATVMIVGLGAVGGYALEALARAGVGNLILVDFDKFDETNINRQILALSSTVGMAKTEVAAQRVREINPDCNVRTCNVFVDAMTIPGLLSEQIDFVVDAIDSLSSKCLLIEELWRRNIPFITSMGAALKTDVSTIKLSTLNKTEGCRLAKQVRQKLRQKDVVLSEIVCVFSSEKNNIGVNAFGTTDNNNERRPMGALPTITGIFGLTMANYVITQLSKAEFK